MKTKLICECGNKRFYVSSDGKIAKCSKCGTIYDKTGTALKTIEPAAQSITVGKRAL